MAAFFQTNFYQNNFYQTGNNPPVPTTPTRPLPKLASFVFFESPGPSGVGPEPPRKKARTKTPERGASDYPTFKPYAASGKRTGYKKPPKFTKH